MSRAIKTYYRRWQKLPESARTPIITIENQAGIPTQNPLDRILLQLGAPPMDAVVLGRSQIVLQGIRRSNVWGLLLMCLGVFLSAMAYRGALPDPGYGWDRSSSRSVLGIGMLLLGCLWGVGYNVAKLLRPPSLVLDSKGITMHLHLFKDSARFTWKQVESVCPVGRGWTLCAREKPHASVYKQELCSLQGLSAEEVGILVNAYRSAATIPDPTLSL